MDDLEEMIRVVGTLDRNEKCILSYMICRSLEAKSKAWEMRRLSECLEGIRDYRSMKDRPAHSQCGDHQRGMS